MSYFSVVIPAYNASKTIALSLKSLVEQDDKDFEVIIVDDYSNDFEQLKLVISKFNHLNIKLYRHEKNKNGAAARNTGIINAGGSYIAFLDADDCWKSCKLSQFRYEIEKDKSENTVYYSRLEVIKPKGQVILRPERSILPKEHISDYIFFSQQLIQTSTIVVKRALAEKVGFDERFIRHQDYDFVLRAYGDLGCTFKLIDSDLTTYTSSDDALSRSISLGESSKYSKFWLAEMRNYMTRNAIEHYRFFFLSQKLKKEGKYFELAVTLVLSYMRMKDRSRANIWIHRKLKG